MSSSRNILVRELNNKLSPLISNNNAKQQQNGVVSKIHQIKSENKKFNSTATAAAAATACPHLAGTTLETGISRHQEPSEHPVNQAWIKARPYEEVPGPKPIPILGNTWRYV